MPRHGCRRVLPRSRSASAGASAKWLATNPSLDGVTAKAMLSDQQDPLLPIYRLSAEDPDDENTLATAIFTLSATRVAWQVFTLDRENAVLQGSL